MSRKYIIKNIIILSLVFTIYIFYITYFLNYQFKIKDIIIKYGEALLIWLFLEIYLKIMLRVFKINSLLKYKKIDLLLFLKIIFIGGIIIFGVGVGTSLLLVSILILNIKIVNMTQIINLYLLCIIGGVIFSILMITSVIIYNKIKQRKNNEIIK